VKVIVVADTHTRGRSRQLPAGAWPYLETADHILHAGDVCEPALLDELAALAPVTAVAGNCDAHEVSAWGANDEARVELGGVRIGMIHDSGRTDGRRARLRQMFPGCRVAIFGHSHKALIDDDGELMLLNPGSACDARWGEKPSLALLECDAGNPRVRLIDLSRSNG
jgi:putative phosphoesterase